MTDMEKLKATLAEIGVPFETTDDSEESGLDEVLDTVVEVHDNARGAFCKALFLFRRDGSFKEFAVL